MLKLAAQFVYNLLSGTALHVIAMLVGFLLTMILMGKTDENFLHLFLGVMVPFFIAGALMARERFAGARVISVLSAALALTVPPLAISFYWGWEMPRGLGNYGWTLTAIPFSLWGCLWMQNRQSEADRSGSEATSPASTPAKGLGRDE